MLMLCQFISVDFSPYSPYFPSSLPIFANNFLLNARHYEFYLVWHCIFCVAFLYLLHFCIWDLSLWLEQDQRLFPLLFSQWSFLCLHIVSSHTCANQSLAEDFRGNLSQFLEFILVQPSCLWSSILYATAV